MDEEEIKSIIRDYIVEHLKVDVSINRYTSWGESPSIKIAVFMDDELISESIDYLPEPKITY